MYCSKLSFLTYSTYQEVVCASCIPTANSALFRCWSWSAGSATQWLCCGFTLFPLYPKTQQADITWTLYSEADRLQTFAFSQAPLPGRAWKSSALQRMCENCYIKLKNSADEPATAAPPQECSASSRVYYDILFLSPTMALLFLYS